MTMLKLHPGQRALLAEKGLDLANLAVGALTFGQFLGTTILLTMDRLARRQDRRSHKH
jgi:hypothetical protein